MGRRHAAPVRHRQGAGATPRRLPLPQPPRRRRSASCSVAGGRAGAACAARPLSGTGGAARRGRGRPAQVGARVLRGAVRGVAAAVPVARPLSPLVQLSRSLPAPLPRPLRDASSPGRPLPAPGLRAASLPSLLLPFLPSRDCRTRGLSPLWQHRVCRCGTRFQRCRSPSAPYRGLGAGTEPWCLGWTLLCLGGAAGWLPFRAASRGSSAVRRCCFSVVSSPFECRAVDFAGR